MPSGFANMGGMPPGGGGFGMGGMPGGGRSFHFSTNGGSGFNFSNPEDIFSSFFKQGGANMGDDDDIFASFGGGGLGRGRGGGARGGAPRARPRARSPEVTTVEKPLPVSLEDLFKGALKKMKIKRKTFDPTTGKRSVEDSILDIKIEPGYKAGTKIKFKGVGDQEEGGTQDLHFIITEVSLFVCLLGGLAANIPLQKEHPLFKRDGDDLRMTIELDLKEALTGWQRTVSTIDGRQLPASGGGPTQPGYEIRFPNQGMPKRKNPSDRGDMIVQVKVKFPTSLTQAQKSKLKEIL